MTTSAFVLLRPCQSTVIYYNNSFVCLWYDLFRGVGQTGFIYCICFFKMNCKQEANSLLHWILYIDQISYITFIRKVGFTWTIDQFNVWHEPEILLLLYKLHIAIFMSHNWISLCIFMYKPELFLTLVCLCADLCDVSGSF